ncbi:MAG: PDZ domain-containing protein [Bacillota bacterium]
MEVIIEVLKAIGWFFVNPLFYWFFILIYISSTKRVEKERFTFGYKVFPTLDEWYGLKRIGLILSILLSVMFIGLGIFLPPLMIVLLVIFSLLFSLTGKFSWLNSVYIFGASSLTLLFYPYYERYLPDLLKVTLILDYWIIFTSLMGVFILVEAFLLTRTRDDQTFPERFVGARGKQVGQHRIKKLALLPLLFIWPIGDLDIFFQYWPVFDYQGESYGLIFFPLLLGLEHVIRTQRPKVFSQWLLKRLTLLGMSVIMLSLAGFLYAPLILLSIIVGLIGREILLFRTRQHEANHPTLYGPSTDGLKVLGVHPFSPASEMGIEIGEVITKVNGHKVSNGNEFYQALQSNLAFCKIDIYNLDGEIRFTQRAYYEGDHHQLGLVFVEG